MKKIQINKWSARHRGQATKKLILNMSISDGNTSIDDFQNDDLFLRDNEQIIENIAYQ